jgi:hypothetical protein
MAVFAQVKAKRETSPIALGRLLAQVPGLQLPRELLEERRRRPQGTADAA